MAKILLVEDDNNLREIYEARLQAEGYTIISASDGEEALVLAKNEKPDLIISDVMMPKISGFEMLDILRNTEGLKQVRVIMLTALGQSDDQQRATRLGADHYLVKSQVTLEDIVKVAQEMLEDQSGGSQPPVGTTSTEPPVVPPAPPIPPTQPPVPPEPPVTPLSPPGPPISQPPPAPPTTGAPPVVSPPSFTPSAGSAPAVSTSEPVLTAPAVSAPVAAPAPVIPEPVVATPPAPTVAAVSESEEETATTSPPITDSNEQTTTIDTPESQMINVAEEEKVENDVAQTTAEEEASVEAKIEDFVKGATTTAPAPESPPGTGTSTGADNETSNEDAEPSPQTISSLAMATPSAEPVAPNSEVGTNIATDDKIMANAVNSLISQTSAPEDQIALPTETGQVPSSIIENVIASVEKLKEPSVNETSSTPLDAVPRVVLPSNYEAAKNDAVPIAHKKIISPVDALPPKHDLKTLLSLEEAKEATPQVSPAPEVITDQQAAQTMTNATSASPIGTILDSPEIAEAPSAGTMPENPSLDPNSIAL